MTKTIPPEWQKAKLILNFLMKESHPFSKNPLLDEILQPRRIAFIVNPKAGTRLQNSIRENLEKHLSHRIFTYQTLFTEKSGHATELARQAAANGFDVVVAVGGDGSINEVAAGLVGTKVALGIVPAGSGNGLAMHLGYGRDIAGAVKKLNFAEEKTIDGGLLNGQFFINLAGIGFDGMVSNLMRNAEKRGFFPYFLKSVEAGLNYEPKDCRLEIDGKIVEEKCFAITVANGPMYGYNFQIAPDALLDDGFFEIVLLKDAPRWQYFAALPSMLNGGIYEQSFVQHFHAKRLKISCEGENYVHLDGEGDKMTGDLNFEIMPKCLKILVPKST